MLRPNHRRREEKAKACCCFAVELGAQGGSEIKHTGDGIMASFPTASGALECAVAIQRAVIRRSKQALASPVARPQQGA